MSNLSWPSVGMKVEPVLDMKTVKETRRSEENMTLGSREENVEPLLQVWLYILLRPSWISPGLSHEAETKCNKTEQRNII